jgi:transcriptional regulator with XRE-family HTH domain
MEFQENVKNTIITLRKEKGITQDVLASALDISVQAVSKWETGGSLPDILQLPRIAQFFGVSIDYLFYGDVQVKEMISKDLPNDNIIRIIQFQGNRMIDVRRWNREESINLKIPTEFIEESVFNFEIWGNASIDGNVNGYVESEGSVSCSNIKGYVESGGTVNCGNVGGYVECEGAVNCGDIGGYLESGGGVNCGNVGSYVECENNINCGNVSGYAESGGSISCGEIASSVECEGDLKCSNIQGSVECQGDIQCETILGNVECEGGITFTKA